MSICDILEYHIEGQGFSDMAFMTANQAWTRTLAERADAARNKAADAAYNKARVALAETHNAKAAALNADHQAKQDALYAELQTARAALKADYLLAKEKA